MIFGVQSAACFILAGFLPDGKAVESCDPEDPGYVIPFTPAGCFTTRVQAEDPQQTNHRVGEAGAVQVGSRGELILLNRGFKTMGGDKSPRLVTVNELRQ